MNTKIDISLLDETTKAKIEKMADRCEALFKGVEFELKIKNSFFWDADETGFACCIGPENIDWDAIQKQQDAIVNKYNAEIKEILDFSDNCADQLGVDRSEFFDQYFAA